jgi:hypothetical protein
MYNKRVLSTAVSELGKAKAPAKKRDIPVSPEKISRPFVSEDGYKQGPPPPGQHYRIPSDTVYNPTPYRIKAVSNNNITQYLEPGDTTSKVFPGAKYIDEYPAMAEGGNRGTNRALFYKKGGEKKFSRSLEAKNRLFMQNPLIKKKKSKKKKIFDPNAKYFKEGGIQEDLDYIEADLTPEEIAEYRAGGYIIEELPIAQKGGSQIYTYADRPEAKYKKDASGNWLISLPSTKGQYVPIKDPTGKRAGELNEKAKPYKPAAPKSNLSSYEDRINKPQVSDNTAVRNYPVKNVPAKPSAMDMLKTTPSQLAAADAVKRDKTLSTDQKFDLLSNRQKLDEYASAVDYAKRNEARVKQVSKRKNNPYSRERLWDIATNPFDAFKYAVSEGGLENMPYNYNKMKDAGIDPSASSFQERFGYGDEGRGKGSNLVGNALNDYANLFDAGDKLVRDVKNGDYFGALMNAGRFVVPSAIALRTSANMTKAGIRGGRQLGETTKKITNEISDRIATATKLKLNEMNYEAKLMGLTIDDILKTTKPGRKISAKARDIRTAGLKNIKTTTKGMEFGLGKIKQAYNTPLLKSQKTREEGVKWINEHGRVRDTWRPGATRQYNSFEEYVTPAKLSTMYTVANAAYHMPDYISKHRRSLEKIAENPDEAKNYINMGWNMIRYVGDLTSLNKTVDAIHTPMKVYDYFKKAYEENDPLYGAKAILSLAGMQRASTRKEGGETDINKRRQVLRDWTYGADIGMLQEQDGGEYWEDEIDEPTRQRLLELGYQVEDLD